MKVTPPKATITVTGVDEHTPLQALLNIARMPNVEVSFLYTRTPEGRNRYPSRDWLIRALPRVSGHAALHVCGSGARAELVSGDMGDLLAHVRRIQVNGILQADEVERICYAYPSHGVITQHKPENAHLLAVQAPNHALLIDASGGRGLAPDGWHRPDTAKAVGFAGGLGPSSMTVELPRIQTAAIGDWWVDMEGKIRTEDWFDASLAAKSILLFNGFTGVVDGVSDLEPEDLDWVVAQAVASSGNCADKPRSRLPGVNINLVKLAILTHLLPPTKQK
jgi:hypothetical protein